MDIKRMGKNFGTASLLFGLIFVFSAVVCAGNDSLQGKNTDHGVGNGSFKLVGMGPGDADLLTQRAVNEIRRADIVFCDPGSKDNLSPYMDFEGKQVLEGYGRLFRFYGKDCDKLSREERSRHSMSCEDYHCKQAEFANLVRRAVAAGKHVVLLSGGDPTIYGPDMWALKELRELDPSVVPGLSAFNAANAALRAGVTEGKSSHSIILASGWSVEEMAGHRSTMVLFTMRTQLKKFIDGLSKHYPSDTPVGIVFSAGYAEKEKVVRGTLGTLLDTVGENRLPFEYLLYVGDFLAREPMNVSK